MQASWFHSHMALDQSRKERPVNTWLYDWGEKAAQSHPAPRTLGKFSPVGKQQKSGNCGGKTEQTDERQKHQILGGLETATHTPSPPPPSWTTPNISVTGQALQPPVEVHLIITKRIPGLTRISKVWQSFHASPILQSQVTNVPQSNLPPHPIKAPLHFISYSFFFLKILFFPFLPKIPWYLVVYFQLWVLLVVACGTPPQHGLMSSATSAPRIRTSETLGRQSRVRNLTTWPRGQPPHFIS